MNVMVADIKTKFQELGVDIPAEKIEERLEKLIVKFKVPQEEAKRSVVNFFLKEYSLSKDKFYGGQGEATFSKVADISEDGKWVNLKVKVVQIWENTHGSISQVGLLADETGTIKFIAWAAAEVPAVEEGRSYIFKNVVSSEWNGKMEVTLNKSSSIEEIADDIHVQSRSKGVASLVKVADISEDGRWVDLKGKIVQLWENNKESISQVGLIGDETGSIKFIKWASAEIPVDLVEGKNYLFRNAVTSEWNGKFEITLNKSSSIEEIFDEIEVNTRDTVLTAAMVDIQSGSGLIKRCPQCNRSLTKGACAEHGKVDGVYDLRLKAVLDTGAITQDILLKRDVTEDVSGITLESAIAMAADALDQGVVLEAMKQKLVGKYYKVSGPRVDRYILVESIEQESVLDQKLLAELIKEAEVI
ncbi:MAG: replication protein A [Methanomethylovorans sp.]|uniref:replication protein A n=1 Tax=Methanomethylovorans sp. TaxID=2758717 RepID=UPI003530FCFF